MLRAIVNLLILGLVGIAAVSVVFGVLIPLATWLVAAALKILVILLVAYVILRLVSPEKAEQMRDKIRREK